MCADAVCMWIVVRARPPDRVESCVSWCMVVAHAGRAPSPSAPGAPQWPGARVFPFVAFRGRSAGWGSGRACVVRWPATGQFPAIFADRVVVCDHII